MIRSIFSRSVLAATFCVLASAQSAFAAAPLSSFDVNDVKTFAGRAHKAEMDRTAEACPWADKSSRDVVAKADVEASVPGTRFNGTDTRR